MSDKIKVNLEECDLVLCKCGGDTWMQVTKIKTVKGILVGQSQDQFVNQAATVCIKCGSHFDPEYKQVKQIVKKLEKV